MLLLQLQLLLLQPLQPLPEGGKKKKKRGKGGCGGDYEPWLEGWVLRGVFRAFSGELSFSLLLKPIYFL